MRQNGHIGHIDSNIADTIFRVCHMPDVRGAAADMLWLWLPITLAVDPVSKAALPPPPPTLYSLSVSFFKLIETLNGNSYSGLSVFIFKSIFVPASALSETGVLRAIFLVSGLEIFPTLRGRD